MTEDPALSVVVATRNRAASLGRLLGRLREQVDTPPFEVVVADNGSTDDTPNVIARAQASPLARMSVHGVRVDEPGKGRALNAALELARGDLIVFTDDDVDPDERWLAELHAGARAHPEVNLFGGRIEVDRDAVPGWVRRSHNLMGLLTSEHLSPGPDQTYGFGRYPFGPNMAVRRSAITAHEARYPEDLGPGTGLPVGDEGAFLSVMSPPGARDRRHLPNARVRHEVEAENVTFRDALRRSWFQGRAQARSGIAPGPTGPLLEPPASLARMVVDRIRACRSVREFFCVCVRQVGYMRG